MSEFVDERVPYSRRIFCNRNLRFDRLRFIGFDMDYTLARYTEAMEYLQSEMALARLVQRYGYDRGILALRYDPAFAIRGLTVDTARGNILKMDSHRFVGRVWHGTRQLEGDQRRGVYTNRKVSPSDERYVMVDTLFSLPEISLYSQLVDYVDAMEPHSTKPTYDKLWNDLRSVMDSLHRDGTLKARIRADLSRYIFKDDELAETLHRFRSSGKKLFVLTNSEADYTQAVMSYLLDGSYPGYATWQDYFDFVGTSAQKPAFFTSEEPFYEVDSELQVTAKEVTKLKRGVMVSGGNFLDLARLTGMVGEEVMYVGDHIYGDILRSKVHTHWRTAMVVQEMEDELDQIHAHREALEELEARQRHRFQLTLELAARALDGDRAEALRSEIRELGRSIHEFEQGFARSFNPAWGMLFRDRAELSAFGAQIEDYACIYTSRVSNFRLYSPQWYFRSPRDRMAHELRL